MAHDLRDAARCGALPQDFAAPAVDAVDIEFLRPFILDGLDITKNKPVLRLDAPFSATALVTKMRSPQMIGLECPRPGISVFHKMFLSDFTFHSDGGDPLATRDVDAAAPCSFLKLFQEGRAGRRDAESDITISFQLPASAGPSAPGTSPVAYEERDSRLPGHYGNAPREERVGPGRRRPTTTSGSNVQRH
jgi:hypothetical protein